MESKFIKCECSGEVLEVEYYNYGENDTGFYVSLWERYGNSRTLTLKERIEWCVNILFGKKLYTDGIILTNEKAKQIASYINEHIK